MPYTGQLPAGVRAVLARRSFCPSLLPSQHAAACGTRYVRAILILMPTNKLTAEIINAAVEGFEQQKLRIDAQIAELRQMLHGGPTEAAAAPKAPTGKRRKMSAAVRKRMGDAQRKRWAEAKKDSEPSPVAPEASKPKRKLSAAGKAAIVAALKKRW